MMMNNLLSQIMCSGGNPRAILMNMLQQQSNNNPIMNNVIQMMNNGDSKGIEMIARNIAKERGINPDAMINELKNQTNTLQMMK